MSLENLAEIYPQRQVGFAEIIQSSGLQGMAINASPTLTYLTGLHFHLTERPVVCFFQPGGAPLIVLPELEAGKLEQVTYPIQPFTYGEDPDTWPGVFKDALQAARLAGQRVGVESSWMRVLDLSYLEAADLGIQFDPGDACAAKVRIRKDAAEIGAMQEAVYMAQKALQAALPKIEPGITEKQLAAEITSQLFQNGSESKLPFTPIVASGPNTAYPHAFPGDRRLEKGDILLIDWGGNISGYFSDLTRTFVLGEAVDEIRLVAQTVQSANKAAREIAGPGITAHLVDQAARQVIEEAGFGKYFIHRTGHGLGLEVHEPPYIRGGNQMLLESGMTFTIEPGIYIPGLGGVRIEDDVVVTDQGLRSFSDLPRELSVLEI